MIDNTTVDRYKIYRQVCDSKYLYKGTWRGVIASHVTAQDFSRLKEVQSKEMSDRDKIWNTSVGRQTDASLSKSVASKLFNPHIYK